MTWQGRCKGAVGIRGLDRLGWGCLKGWPQSVATPGYMTALSGSPILKARRVPGLIDLADGPKRPLSTTIRDRVMPSDLAVTSLRLLLALAASGPIAKQRSPIRD